jgi:hypothetical protein
MESTTYAVHQSVHRTENVDGLPDLAPAPTSIKEQMPELAALLQQLAASMGCDAVQAMVKAATALRVAYDRDDFGAVSQAYARGDGWIDATEGGCQVGVPKAYMAAFARRHRQTGGGAR